LILAAQRAGLVFSTCDDESMQEVLEWTPMLDSELDNEKLKKALENVWQDGAIRQVFSERDSLEDLPTCAEYLFKNLTRLLANNYIPTTEDVLRCRQRTSGIIETEFSVGGLEFKMVDVGGQRSERRKWIHCFNDVQALIFVVAINEYDMKLSEDKRVNRMMESLLLWQEIRKNEWFSDSSIILFLNKSDLFREKITKVDLNVTFKDYSGGKSYENALSYINKLFVSDAGRDIFVHVTCATDTKTTQVVFDSVRSTIMESNMEEGGMRLV